MKLFFLTLILMSLNFANTHTKYTNALIDEQSPYLLQHAHNPVNWLPWNKQVFEKAKKENKLIFISIGYSTCHWCHVMEEESFENETIAKLLNKDYISIKVDKEEMPHLDTAFQQMHSRLKSRRNGWPLNLILTPDKKLVYITTYIPPTHNYGVEGMDTLIPRIAKAYNKNDPQLIKQIEHYEFILKSKQKESLKPKSSSDLAQKFVDKMGQRYDKIFSGFDKSPKFPLASHLNLLLDIYLLKDNKEALNMANRSLIAMANGGIYDQIQGAFYRYSVYPDWIIPHFEKMLYTTAELIPVYYKAYSITKNELFKTIIINSIKEINRVFRTNEGLYYSASDADSLTATGQKEEGYYFVYSYEEVQEKLLSNGIQNYEQIISYLGLDDFGNFEKGLSNPYIVDHEDPKPKNLAIALNLLKQIRQSKKPPFVDKKIITSWNSMMIKALFIASKFDVKYLTQAQQSKKSLLKYLYKNNTLYHQKFDDKDPIKLALLEDYAFIIDMLLQSYQTTYTKKDLNLAKELAVKSIKEFQIINKWYLSTQYYFQATFKDKYYTAPLARHFHNLLTVSNLTYDLKMLQQSKKFIQHQHNKILQFIDVHPEAIRSIIRVQSADVILKSNQKNLRDNQAKISSIKYPFVY
ncbi:MAG: DUF255 domain-containing protein, partial [Campylobacterota bacterium]|nr:DUF255 domain-containing protein [Campylobacterota bacterium]